MREKLVSSSQSPPPPLFCNNRSLRLRCNRNECNEIEFEFEFECCLHGGGDETTEAGGQHLQIASRTLRERNRGQEKQIENLMQEKARFEERVHVLEDAQLSAETHGGNLLQF